MGSEELSAVEPPYLVAEKQHAVNPTYIRGMPYTHRLPKGRATHLMDLQVRYNEEDLKAHHPRRQLSWRSGILTYSGVLVVRTEGPNCSSLSEHSGKGSALLRQKGEGDAQQARSAISPRLSREQCSAPCRVAENCQR